jgi:hypothetical protein
LLAELAGSRAALEAVLKVGSLSSKIVVGGRFFSEINFLPHAGLLCGREISFYTPSVTAFLLPIMITAF